jgi:hypothetical protein
MPGDFFGVVLELEDVGASSSTEPSDAIEAPDPR